MKNHPYYTELRRLAFKDKYTTKQVQNATLKQVCNQLDKQDITISFLRNMKALLITELQAKQNEADEQRIKDTLDAGFPDWDKTEKGKELFASEVIK